ncbi:hypothetical protein C8R44DRAFT_748971 [Mycena epipterygia]|nr:hypothetical protein C8R44DRAFT_748971 [Mycena epipterygia]
MAESDILPGSRDKTNTDPAARVLVGLGSVLPRHQRLCRPRSSTTSTVDEDVKLASSPCHAVEAVAPAITQDDNDLSVNMSSKEERQLRNKINACNDNHGPAPVLLPYKVALRLGSRLLSAPSAMTARFWTSKGMRGDHRNCENTDIMQMAAAGICGIEFRSVVQLDHFSLIVTNYA